MACANTEVSRDGLISQPVASGRPDAMLGQVPAQPDPGAVRAAMAVVDREVAQARQLMSVASTPSVFGSAVNAAERAVIDARRKGVPATQLRDQERAVSELKQERDRRISDAIRQDLQRAAAAAGGGRSALAAVLRQRAKTLTYTVGGKSEKNNTDSGGVVIFNAKSTFTISELEQMSANIDEANNVRRNGGLSPSGKVHTSGPLRLAANRAAQKERRRAAGAGTPYSGHVGHAPDTTWTGRPGSQKWHDQTPRVNTSLGAQSRRYPTGFKPTDFGLAYSWQTPIE